jgi:hypothetical protein
MMNAWVYRTGAGLSGRRGRDTSALLVGLSLGVEVGVEQTGRLLLGARHQVPITVEGDPDIGVARNVVRSCRSKRR